MREDKGNDIRRSCMYQEEQYTESEEVRVTARVVKVQDRGQIEVIKYENGPEVYSRQES